MPSFVSRISRFARSPQGRKLSNKAQSYARSEKGKRQISSIRSRVGRGRPR